MDFEHKEGGRRGGPPLVAIWRERQKWRQMWVIYGGFRHITWTTFFGRQNNPRYCMVFKKPMYVFVVSNGMRIREEIRPGCSSTKYTLIDGV